MGHRALVARERPAGAYDVYYSHQGGADLSLAGDLDRRPWDHPLVDPDPVTTGTSWDGLLADHLDPLVHEALFVVAADGPVAAYRPFWPGPLPGGGALVAVDPAGHCDDAATRGTLRGARAGLAAAVEHRDLDAAAAGEALRAALVDVLDDREVAWLDG